MRRTVCPAAFALAIALVAPQARAACAGRPTDAGGVQGYAYGAAEVKTFATPQVLVHYALTGAHAPTLVSKRADGVPDTVAFAADTAEDALTRYGQMGYQKVPGDTACPSSGGDAKIDLYLVHFPSADGSTVVECTGAVCSSFMLVESRFDRLGYANAEEGFRTVITHELFHAVQNTYKSADDGFWSEGTAQWAMKSLHPELQDFEHHLPAFFKDTTRSIDAPPSGVTSAFLYGSAVWPLFLGLKYGPDTVREIFEAEAGGAVNALAATDAVLRKKGASLAGAYPLFAGWNAATGKLAGDDGYPDAAKYPGITVSPLEDGIGNTTSGLGYFAYRGTLDARRQIALDTDAMRNGGLVVPIEEGKPALARAQELPANAQGDVLVIVAGTTTKKTDAPFVVRLLPPAPPPPVAGVTPHESGCRLSRRRSGSPLGGLGLVGLAGLAIARRARRR